MVNCRCLPLTVRDLTPEVMVGAEPHPGLRLVALACGLGIVVLRASVRQASPRRREPKRYMFAIVSDVATAASQEYLNTHQPGCRWLICLVFISLDLQSAKLFPSTDHCHPSVPNIFRSEREPRRLHSDDFIVSPSNSTRSTMEVMKPSIAGLENL